MKAGSVSKKATMDSDGAGGLNDRYANVYGAPYPTEALIAQTWHKELAAEAGAAIAQEYSDCHIYGWYEYVPHRFEWPQF